MNRRELLTGFLLIAAAVYGYHVGASWVFTVYFACQVRHERRQTLTSPHLATHDHASQRVAHPPFSARALCNTYSALNWCARAWSSSFSPSLWSRRLTYSLPRHAQRGDPPFQNRILDAMLRSPPRTGGCTPWHHRTGRVLPQGRQTLLDVPCTRPIP